MTAAGENPEQNPLSCGSVLCWRTMTSSEVYRQPPHAALLSSELADQHIPAPSSNKNESACGSRCTARAAKEKRTESLSQSGAHARRGKTRSGEHRPRRARRSDVDSGPTRLLTQQHAAATLAFRLF